ncbi:MAG: hypothetical protein HZA34_01370 [Candidatus Pacebacteria bacterium]|nr:hypothetical protein [Candidatus Paceibacterota bacterium]
MSALSLQETRFSITYGGTLVAVIVRKDHPVDNVEFVGSEEQPLQLGFHEKKAGVVLFPHLHSGDPRTITAIQEVLYIVKGKIRITYYTLDGKKIDSVDLFEGDTVLQVGMAHGIEIIEDARVIEVKQGPYHGTTNVKVQVQ